MNRHAQGELLGQVLPGVTTPVTLYSAGALRTEITLIQVGVITGPVIATLYHDDDGSTYDNTTLLYEMQLDNVADATGVLGVPAFNPFFQAQHPGSGIHIKPGGSIGIAIDSASAANISAYGITESIADRLVAARGR